MKKIILMLLIFVLLISGCAREELVQPTLSSEEQTETIPKPSTETRISQTGMRLIVSPSEGNRVKETITITLVDAPAETQSVGFYLERKDSKDTLNGPPNLGLDNNALDGWSLEVNTTIYENNNYAIYALAFAEKPNSGVEPLATAQTEVIINNPLSLYRRNYPAIIKGNWEPSTEQMSQILNSEVEKLKNLGVNTVSIVLEYNLNKDGSYYLEEEEIYISQLKKAKQAGFAVLVSPNFVGASGHNYAEEGINIDLERHLKNSKEVALKWAKIAEQYQAEYFAPQNEFNGPIRGNFAKTEKEEARITTEWHREMLLKLKTIFTGKLMAKLDEPREGIDVTGYDYVGITISHGNGNLNNVRNHIVNQYITLKEIASDSNAQWLVSEAWFPYSGPWYSATTNEDGESLDELQDDYYKMSLEEYQKAGGKDYIFIAWLMPGMGIKGRPAEQVIRNYFKQI